MTRAEMIEVVRQDCEINPCWGIITALEGVKAGRITDCESRTIILPLGMDHGDNCACKQPPQ